MIIEWGGNTAEEITTWYLKGGSIVIDESYMVHVAAAEDAAFCMTFADAVMLGIDIEMEQLELTISMEKLEITFGEVVCQNT